MQSPVTFILIAATALLSWLAFSNRRLADRLILWPPAISRRHEYWRLVSYGFLHADLAHLLFQLPVAAGKLLQTLRHVVEALCEIREFRRARGMQDIDTFVIACPQAERLVTLLNFDAVEYAGFAPFCASKGIEPVCGYEYEIVFGSDLGELAFINPLPEQGLADGGRRRQREPQLDECLVRLCVGRSAQPGGFSAGKKQPFHGTFGG